MTESLSLQSVAWVQLQPSLSCYMCSNSDWTRVYTVTAKVKERQQLWSICGRTASSMINRIPLFFESYHNDGLHTEELIVWNTANRPQTCCQWAYLAKLAPKGERQSVNALISAAPFQVKHFSQCVWAENAAWQSCNYLCWGDNVLFSFSGISPNHFSWFLWYLVDRRDEIHLAESYELQPWESPINLPSILKWCQGVTTAQSRAISTVQAMLSKVLTEITNLKLQNVSSQTNGWSQGRLASRKILKSDVVL